MWAIFALLFTVVFNVSLSHRYAAHNDRNVWLLASMKYISLCVIFFLTACNAPLPVVFAPLNFAERSPIYLDVASIDVRNNYSAPQRPPNVEHLFPVVPEQAMAGWVSARLNAVGRDKTLLVEITDASVVQETLPTTPGLGGLFKVEQEYKYTANAAMQMKIYGDRAVSLASVEVRATRHATAGEGLTLIERDQLYYDLTRALMEDLNAELEKNIQLYFSNYIHYTQ